MADSHRGDRARACARCSRAKVRCIWPRASGDAANTCQRCSKSGITCSKSRSVSTKKRGKANHAKIMDQKLDEIMSLLGRDKLSQSALLPAQEPSTTTAQPLETLSPAQSGSIVLAPGLQIPLSEVGQILEEYMSTMLPQFPFIPLPGYNAHDLLRDKPFLLKTVLWTCRPPAAEKTIEFEGWFRQHVAHQTVVLMNKNLDLLQAILVFLAWKHIYFYAAAEETSLLQLAVGLVGDLGLNRPRLSTNPASIVEDAAQLRNDLPPQPKQTSEAHRAALGVYYLTSILCTLLGKRSRLEYTAPLEHSCRQLARNPEYHTDLLLVNLVRVQQFAIKVHDVLWEAGDSRPEGIHAMAVASIRKELETFMQQLPEHLKWNSLLRTHCAAVRIRLFEPFKHGDKSDMSGSTDVRCRIMMDCLNSTQELCDAFRSVPVESYPSLTFVPVLLLALATIKAARLLGVQDSGWDLGTARNMCNLSENLQQLQQLFETASRLGSPRCGLILHGRPIFTEYADGYRGIERWYASVVRLAVNSSSSTLIEPVFLPQGGQDAGFLFWNQLSDLTYGFDP